MATILFFGRLSEASETIDMALPETVKDTEALIAWLSERDAGLKTALAAPGTRIAVNKNMISTATPILNSDEIAFMSPLSGG